jgi:hypothetical protein
MSNTGRAQNKNVSCGSDRGNTADSLKGNGKTGLLNEPEHWILIKIHTSRILQAISRQAYLIGTGGNLSAV